uniref:Pin2 terf1-interacting telomerase inhibitor 1 n=1 Tax=Triatoma infestans TaxID=30076 RepID=A0A161ML19_TRIIF
MNIISMSMLAEKRRKQTWILNPRSTDWSEDGNKYGQRMLEKMGWTPGKGLGVNEQGIVNALRVKYKSDLRGLGCDSKIEEWTKTQEEFNALLGELAGNEKDSKIGSLEKTSKNIRNRVHYHKFTRRKDLSRYSAKDLESILGLNNLISSKNTIGESVNKGNCENKIFRFTIGGF